jgi:hypothetical protein
MEKQMKTQSSTVRNAFFKLVLVWLLIVNTFGIVQAQPPSDSPSAEMKYIGIVDDKLVFEIEYKNDAQNTFTLEIKDEEGFQFYHGKFKQKSFKKQFAISKDELGDNSITFLLAAQGKVQKQVFDINPTSRMVEEVSVVKL